MPSSRVTPDDVAGLLDVLQGDADRRTRQAATSAVVSLPLATPAAEQVTQVLQGLVEDDGRRPDHPFLRQAIAKLQPAATERPPASGALRSGYPAPSAGTPASAKARSLADQVRASLLTPGRFPADLTLLASLPDEDAHRLVSDLVGQLLAAIQTQRSVLELATRRLGDVVRALTADGRRPVIADFPQQWSWAVPEQRRGWVGGLLALTEPAQILAAVRDHVTVAPADERLTALRQLEAAAPHLGGRVLRLPAPSSRNQGLEQLCRLLESVFAGPRPTRSAARPPDAPGGAPPASAPLAGSESAAPTRSAYARLDAPERVAPREVFEVRVGLAESPSQGVSPAVPMPVPVTPFTLTVQLLANGFQPLGGASLTRQIDVTPEDPYPYDVLRLRADADLDLAAKRAIVAVFSIEGAPIGAASREVQVAAPGTEVPAPPERREPAPGADWVVADSDPATRPDLEILIAPGNDAAGLRLAWTFRSPHAEVGTVNEPITSVIGGNAAAWARGNIRNIEDKKGDEDLAEYLYGLGLDVRDAVPAPVWDAIRAAATVSSPPTVLLATWDPYVPWELAVVPEPWDPNGSPFLGAQAVIGRWPYSEQIRALVPALRIEAQSMATVKGEYGGSKRLEEAEKEADHLKDSYKAAQVPARIRPILDCLGKATPPAHILHMAVHGRFDHTGTQDGILMEDGKYLRPRSIRGVKEAAHVDVIDVGVVFLNACQLGQAQEMLGEYAGMATAFTSLGVDAVIAPLWKVDDAIARKVAEGFYRAVLGDEGLSPAEYLRRERHATKGKEALAEGTRLAYLFFGHPRLRISWHPEGK
jgi:hypothetical protein